MEEKKKELYKQYHPAFCSAMELEFREDKEYLIFDSEYNLNTKPNEIDLLVISRIEGRGTKSRLGAIFKKHNICEFRHPKAGLDLVLYYRSMGYAYLYLAVGKYVNTTDEITISFIRRAYPRKLIKWFNNNGFKIYEYEKGIYHITREHHFDMQIIVTGLLDKKYKWINKLSDSLEKDDFDQMRESFDQLEEELDIINAESVIDFSLSLNEKKEYYKELIGMGWFMEESQKIREEKKRLDQERESIRKEQENVRKEQENVRKEQENVRKEQEKFVREMENAKKEREEMKIENNRLHNEVEELKNQIKDLSGKIAML